MVVRNEVNDVMSYKRQCQEGGKKWAGRKVGVTIRRVEASHSNACVLARQRLHVSAQAHT